MDRVTVESFLARAAKTDNQVAMFEGPLRFGVDLGTATIVITAVDARGAPIYWTAKRASVVRDGVVVDFQGAVAAVRELKAEAEKALGQPVTSAATAYPPGVPQSDCRACRYVLEQAGIECRALVDEISAAQALLGVRDGAIADIGGGSTGVGVFTNGELVKLSDRPGGGHHLDLILAGALRIDVADAEERKRTGDYGALLRPGVERIAESIGAQLGASDVSEVHLVGGALMIAGAADVVGEWIGRKTIGHASAHLVTPFGIAVS